MRKLILVLMLVCFMVPVMADFQDFNWSLIYGKYKSGGVWHMTDGEWKFFKNVHFDETGLVYGRNNQIIGAYWFGHPTNLKIKIDRFNLKFYGSFRFLKNSVILCGTGEIWENRNITTIKIIMHRKSKKVKNRWQ